MEEYAVKTQIRCVFITGTIVWLIMNSRSQTVQTAVGGVWSD